MSAEERKDLLAAYAINFDGKSQSAARAVSAMMAFSEKHNIAITLLLIQRAEQELFGK